MIEKNFYVWKFVYVNELKRTQFQKFTVNCFWIIKHYSCKFWQPTYSLKSPLTDRISETMIQTIFSMYTLLQQDVYFTKTLFWIRFK